MEPENKIKPDVAFEPTIEAADEEEKDPREAAFKTIINAAGEEEYEQCANEALKFLNEHRHDPEAQPYLPYARYFKLFSEAYRTWQISYDYTPIRSNFGLAYDALSRGIKETYRSARHKDDRDDLALLRGFRQLAKMLCAYTRCENSFINNDPFALKRNAEAALRYEKALQYCRLRQLGERKEGTPVERCRGEMASWLCEYLTKNQYLHNGLKVCAECYSNMFQHRRPMKAWETEELDGVEQNDLVKLRELSSELSSELNAHIRHIRQHDARLRKNVGGNTFLKIRKGSLALLMSAAFDTDSARKLFSSSTKHQETLEKFATKVTDGFEGIGVEASVYQMKQLHDIFQTSFGKDYLNVMSFDLSQKEADKAVRVKILDRYYDFDLSISLSALGVCTLHFTLDIDDTLPDGGLSVEEARVLQSLLCPHAGQVEIEDASQVKIIEEFRLMERFELLDLLEEVARLRKWLKKNQPSASHTDTYQSLEAKVEDLDRALIAVEDRLLEQAKATEADGDSDEKIALVKEALKRLIRPDSPLEPEFSEFKEMTDRIASRLNSHHYAAHLAEQYMNVIKSALAEHSTTPTTDSSAFVLATDTGWYTYLYCFAIDEVSMADATDVRASAAGFDEIAGHPDVAGFVVEQREARASFDDWRFIKHSDRQGRNLAHIRSHLTDGFFCTEYQAFLYFPDDPMFLTDQYEATVELMVRLAIVLKYISGKAHDLAENIHTKLHEGGHDIRSPELNRNLSDIRRLRVHAKELQTLVARAAISRYKDHGELMRNILSEMKLDRMADLLDQQLRHLAELYADVLREIEERWRVAEEERRKVEEKRLSDSRRAEEKREARTRITIELLVTVMGLSALPGIVSSVLKVPRVANFFIQCCGLRADTKPEGEAEGVLSIILMAFVFIIFIVIYTKRWLKLRE